MNLQVRHELRGALTPVYPADTKPARPGVYLVALSSAPESMPRVFSYWTGRRWSMTAADARLAEAARRLHSDCKRRAWQGLVRH